jgi:uncharacterized protein DUF6627
MRRKKMPRIDRIVARMLVVCLCFAGLPIPAAHAELIATDQIETRAPSSARERMSSLFDRADVRRALESHGVNAADAQARVAALSDDEVERLAASFDSLPAGGDGIGGVLTLAVVVFLILLLTDILGFTKIFPFTRPAK